MFRKGTCVVIVVALLTHMTGCYSSRMISVSEIEDVEDATIVIVNTNDGRVFELFHVNFDGSKIKGSFSEPDAYNIKVTKSIELDVDDIESIEVQKINYVVWVIGFGAVIWLLVEISKTSSLRSGWSLNLGHV
jgi:hypothetical protein